MISTNCVWFTTIPVETIFYITTFRLFSTLAKFPSIKSDVVSLFANSSFTFLTKLNMWLYLIYLSIWINEYHFVCVKKNIVSYQIAKIICWNTCLNPCNFLMCMNFVTKKWLSNVWYPFCSNFIKWVKIHFDIF
jgi:hypothetical protein